MKKCPYCGGEIPATAKKCSHCGEELAGDTFAGSVSSWPEVPVGQNYADSSRQQSFQQAYSKDFKASPQMSFTDAAATGFKKMFVFKGRSRRSEYWWIQLVIFLIYMAFYFFVLGTVESTPVLSSIIMVAVYVLILIVAISSMVRRLHDIGKSGWYYLLNFIPLIGCIILIVWCCQDSEKDANEYGPSPKYS